MNEQSGIDSECNPKSYSSALSPSGCFPSSLEQPAMSGLLILPTALLFLGLGVCSALVLACSSSTDIRAHSPFKLFSLCSPVALSEKAITSVGRAWHPLQSSSWILSQELCIGPSDISRWDSESKIFSCLPRDIQQAQTRSPGFPPCNTRRNRPHFSYGTCFGSLRCLFLFVSVCVRQVLHPRAPIKPLPLCFWKLYHRPTCCLSVFCPSPSSEQEN